MGSFKDAYKNDREGQAPFLYWLSEGNAVGKVTYNKLQEFYASPMEMARAGRKSWEKTGVLAPGQMGILEGNLKRGDVRGRYERMLSRGINMVSLESGLYPGNLEEIPDPPICLFLMGKLPPKGAPIVSVIGTRECSDYGREVAARIGEAVAFSGISLVSGMARGIDSLSQIGAVEAGGYSLAVLGGGTDVIYPRESRALYYKLLETGGVISEYVPGTEPKPMYFARRNRLISGISHAVCVIEAREKSGTMITVDAALEQGREVYAVPGRITDRSSIGVHELIRQGASIVTSPEMFVESVLENYGMTYRPKAAGNFREDVSLTDGEAAVLTALDDNSFTPDSLKAPGSFGEIMSVLLQLTAKGLVNNLGGGRFVITRSGVELREKIKEENRDESEDEY